MAGGGPWQVGVCGRQESLAGSVIQAAGMAEFEDGLKRRNKFGAINSLQSIHFHTIPEIPANIEFKGRFDQVSPCADNSNFVKFFSIRGKKYSCHYGVRIEVA